MARLNITDYHCHKMNLIDNNKTYLFVSLKVLLINSTLPFNKTYEKSQQQGLGF